MKKRVTNIKLFSMALALMIAVTSTIMILGIQLNFNQHNSAVKITAPIILVCLIAILFIYKFARRQKKISMALTYAEKKGKILSPYLTILFTYFDYMLWCGICSILCGIVSGILGKMSFQWSTAWSYTLSRLAVIFLIYILALMIYTCGLMIAYAVENRSEKK